MLRFVGDCIAVFIVLRLKSERPFGSRFDYDFIIYIESFGIVWSCRKISKVKKERSNIGKIDLKVINIIVCFVKVIITPIRLLVYYATFQSIEFEVSLL